MAKLRETVKNNHFRAGLAIKLHLADTFARFEQKKLVSKHMFKN